MLKQVLFLELYSPEPLYRCGCSQSGSTPNQQEGKWTILALWRSRDIRIYRFKGL